MVLYANRTEKAYGSSRVATSQLLTGTRYRVVLYPSQDLSRFKAIVRDKTMWTGLVTRNNYLELVWSPCFSSTR